MHKQRLESFSDGVIAIILTIMVLDLKVPKPVTVEALAALWPVWLAYALSYYNVFVLWVHHHEALSKAAQVDRGVLFANGLFLFCASLIPFATAMAGEDHWASALPVAVYGAVMVAVSATLGLLQARLSAHCAAPQDAAEVRAGALRSGRQAAFFAAATLAALAHPRAGLLLFVAIPALLRAARHLRHTRHSRSAG